MAHSDICCGLYRGSLYLKERGVDNAALLPVGNAEFSINQEMTELEQPNYQSLGGSACSVSYMNSMTLAMILHCMSPENLALAFLGESSRLTGGVVDDEEHVVNSVDELVPFEHTPDKSQAIVVTNEAETVTYVAGEDYVVTSAGIKILDGDIVIGSTIKVSYTYGKNYVLDAATISQKEFYVVFDGINVGEGGERSVVIKFFKVKFSPTDTMPVISGDAFSSINLNGEVLRDESRATGSKFFQIEWGQQASGGY